MRLVSPKLIMPCRDPTVAQVWRQTLCDGQSAGASIEEAPPPCPGYFHATSGIGGALHQPQPARMMAPGVNEARNCGEYLPFIRACSGLRAGRESSGKSPSSRTPTVMVWGKHPRDRKFHIQDRGTGVQQIPGNKKAREGCHPGERNQLHAKFAAKQLRQREYRAHISPHCTKTS